MKKGETKTEMLHFRVDPSILNIPRQMFWYEDKQAKAIDFMNALTNGKATLEQTKKLLDGDAYFITEDNGDTLTLVDKEDKEWKKELSKHKKFLEDKKKKADELAKRPYCSNQSEDLDCEYKGELDGKCCYSKIDEECYLDTFTGNKETVIKGGAKLMGLDESTATGEKVAEKKGDKCLAKGCQFCLGNNCSFAMRDRWGCFQEDEDVKEKFAEFKLSSTTFGRQGMEGINFVKHQAEKVFNFVYKGHHYTIQDSARNQGECPHCGHQGEDNMWQPTDKAYIGHKYFGMIPSVLGKKEKSYAVCFECPKCFEKFFYHNNYNTLELRKGRSKK